MSVSLSRGFKVLQPARPTANFLGSGVAAHRYRNYVNGDLFFPFSYYSSGTRRELTLGELVSSPFALYNDSE